MRIFGFTSLYYRDAMLSLGMVKAIPRCRSEWLPTPDLCDGILTSGVDGTVKTSECAQCELLDPYPSDREHTRV
jgi:hypothetical protein